MISDEFREKLADYYRAELEKLEELTKVLKAFGMEESEFDPNLNLNRFKIEMMKFISNLEE